jgi:hypothetical protein
MFTMHQPNANGGLDQLHPGLGDVERGSSKQYVQNKEKP